MSIEISEVLGNKDLKAFVRFPYRLYKNHPFWVPPLIQGEWNTLRRDKNPAFEYCEARFWLAWKDGKVAGRIAGIINRKFIETWEKKAAYFGYFEAVDNPKVSEVLFQTVENWAKAQGMDSILGPMGFTNFDHQGMLIDGFDELPTVASTYNYPYYPAHMEASGYQKETDYLEYMINAPRGIPEKAIRISGMVQKRKGIRLYKARSKKELLPHARTIFEIINKTYSPLFSFVEMNDQQIEMYTRKYFPYIQPEYVAMLFDKNDRMVGFQITIPSLSRAMQKAKGRLFPLGFIYLLRALKHPKTLDLYLVGILPEYQNQGLNTIFMTDLISVGLKNGIVSAEANSQLEDNKKVQALWKLYDARQHKRKRIYSKTI